MNDEKLSQKFLGFHHIEFYVGSAKAWTYFHRKGCGFHTVGYRGPETGCKDSISYATRQGKITLVFTSPLTTESEIADHIALHGDGVKDVSLVVDSVNEVLDELGRRKVPLGKHARTAKDEGSFLQPSVQTYGDTVHTLVDQNEATKGGLKGYDTSVTDEDPVGLTAIDHVVGNVEEGMMEKWVQFYERNFGFKKLLSFDDKDISTEYSALRSTVVHDGMRRVVLPINEPAPGKRKSQIQEFLDYYRSPGVQHIAIRTDDIIRTVSEMKKRGVEFLDTPDTYYDELSARVGKLDETVEELRKHRILVDRDEVGYMLQIFTKPICDRPTFFYEIIQRKGGESFGKGNFKALFESIEREQAKRGNL
ncbi:MAG: 4-hydroxyphenylpyruvate dioxygenase [Thermoprotei archaeon]